MRKCRLIEFLFASIPLKKWQDFLIRNHMLGCSFCQARLAGKEEVRSVLFQESEILDLKVFLPEVKTTKTKREPAIFPRMGWAVAVASLVIVVVIGIWFFNLYQLNGTPESPLRFQIEYIKIYDRPARPYIFQPQESNMIFIWAEKNTEGE